MSRSEAKEILEARRHEEWLKGFVGEYLEIVQEGVRKLESEDALLRDFDLFVTDRTY